MILCDLHADVLLHFDFYIVTSKLECFYFGVIAVIYCLSLENVSHLAKIKLKMIYRYWIM